MMAELDKTGVAPKPPIEDSLAPDAEDEQIADNGRYILLTTDKATASTVIALLINR
ncbi:hypothetical protein [Sporolactobacillus sp. KGMB 08714]|uniref:hypothetical protein n=1 Tax=Sporolactobacillus sp. KGMB 08714 TaxID=3064704 RepID=UPI002FBDD350